MQNLLNNLMALGPRRLMILGGVAAAVMLSMLFGISAITSPNYQPLYRNLSAATSASIESTLVRIWSNSRNADYSAIDNALHRSSG